MDLQQKSWLSDVRIETRVAFSDGADSGKRLMSPEVSMKLDISKTPSRQTDQPFTGQVLNARCTLTASPCRAPASSLCDSSTSARTRGFSGLSVFFAFCAPRFSFFRSSLPNVAVFAMSAIGFLLDKFSAVPTGLGYSSYAPPFPALKRWAIIGRPSGALISRTAGKKREASSLKPRATS
jgi:hypothetical protein